MSAGPDIRPAPSATSAGLLLALRRLGNPILAAALVSYLAIGHVTGPSDFLDLGFDFRGTLWEPARAIVHGGSVYPPPTEAAVSVGNPSVYPPLFIVLSVPLALLPFSLAAWLWWLVLALSVGLALWIIGVRDWRCLAVALVSPIVLQGFFFGNLTLLLMVPLALAWRYRSQPWVAGLAVGVAVAAKLFAWPLVFWLLFTRRFKAALVSIGVAAALVVLPWALIGFEGFREYPELIRAVQDVYGRVSLSLATVAAALGASRELATALAALSGLVLVAVAWWLAGRTDGDRRSYSAVIGACILASPIVWQNYLALLFLPIALARPRLALPWFFGFAAWLAALLPKPTITEPEPCCRPPGVPEVIWDHSHATPAWGHAGGTMAVALLVIGWTIMSSRAHEPEPSSSSGAFRPAGRRPLILRGQRPQARP